MRGMGMGMSMRLTQELDQRQEQIQKLTLEQRQVLRQEQTTRFGDNLGRLRGEGPASPDELLDATIEGIVAAIENPEVATITKQFLLLPVTKLALLKYRFQIARGDKDVFQLLVSDIYYPADGLFEFANENPSRVSRGVFDEAVRKPRQLESTVEALKQAIREGQGGVGQEQLREMENALRAAGGMREHMSGYEHLFTRVISRATNEDDKPLLRQFCRNSVVYERLLPVLSQRILTRFTDRFTQITAKSTAREYQDAFLNVIGEYVLVSLGILTQDLFRLNRSYVEVDEYENARDSLAEFDINLDRLMGHWGLTSQGAFFWNRWAVREGRPSRESDNQVREFTTEILRQNGRDILEAVGYEAWFRRVKSLVMDMKDVSHPQERQNQLDELRQILITTLENDKVHATLVRFMKGPWFESLQAFMRSR